MTRRNGYQYLGNKNSSSKEVHNLDNEQSQCQIATIIAHGNDVYFKTLSDAHANGYDNCGHCIGNSKR